MTSLFILQLVCCVITAMLALQLAMASLQVRWKVWRYEISRWLLVASMLFFSVHYLLQMVHGFRAQGTDVGAAFILIALVFIIGIFKSHSLHIGNMLYVMLGLLWLAWHILSLSFAKKQIPEGRSSWKISEVT